MNDHDRDLIMALAEGSLSSHDAEAAAARIAADPELAEELAIQAAVIEHLRDDPVVSLTPAERATLHANLISELHLDAPPTSTPIPVAPRARWWKPVLAVSSVAAVLVFGIAVVPSMLGGSSDDSATVAGADFTPEAATTTVSAGAPQSEESIEQLDAADGGATADVYSLSDVNPDELLEATEGAATPRAIDEAIGESGISRAKVPIDIDEIEACLEDLASALPPGDVVPVGIEEDAESRILHVIVLDDTGGQTAVEISLTSCSLVQHSTLDE